MLVNIYHDSPREHAKLFVSGIAFIAGMAMLVALSIAIYGKAFEDTNTITVEADRAGLQLAAFGDVRLNGALVGSVREIRQNGERAEIEVALDPEVEIPNNAGVQIIPTTLFGQKFLSFVVPDDASSTPLKNDDVIPAERVETNVELSEILADLFPLLRTVRPADLNMTLNALATALEGRGNQLGDTFVDLDTYLNVIDDELPTLREDLILLADVAETYDVAAPDILGVLRNLTVTSNTVVGRRDQLDTFFSDITGLARTTNRILSDNEQSIIEVGEVTAPVLKLFATYSPEFPCLIKGGARYKPLLAKTFEGNEVKQYIEFGTAQYEVYKEDDLPRYGEVGRGPSCFGLPNPPVPIGPNSFKDGTDIDENPPTSPTPTAFQGQGNGRVAPGFSEQSADLGVASGYAGSEADKLLVNALLSGETGKPADTYGSLGSLLYGPVVRGDAG